MGGLAGGVACIVPAEIAASRPSTISPTSHGTAKNQPHEPRPRSFDVYGRSRRRRLTGRRRGRMDTGGAGRHDRVWVRSQPLFRLLAEIDAFAGAPAAAPPPQRA